MRKRGRRSRLLLCFRPAPVEDELRPTKKLKLPADPNGEEDGDVSGDAETTKEKHPHRFSGALKSVMSDIFMTKSLGSRRFRSISLRSPSSKKVQDTNISKTKSETIALTTSSNTYDVFKSNSRHSLSTATITNDGYRALVSPSTSSFSSNSRSVLRRNGTFEANLNELKQLQQQQKKISKNSKFLNTNVGLSLIALSLLILIVWGKICAILCTTTWLLLLSATFKKRGVNKKSSKCDDQLREEEVDSEEHKKKIIIDGLLDRNRGGSRSSRRQ